MGADEGEIFMSRIKLIMHIMLIIKIILFFVYNNRYVVTLCTRWWAEGASMGDLMP